MPIKRFYGFLLLVTLFSGLSSAQIFKTVDDNGNVSFSDSPPPKQQANTQKLELGSTNTSAAITPPKPQSSEEKAANGKYAIALTQPANQANITAGQRDLKIQTSVSPGMSPELQVIINLDGQDIKTGRTGGITINNITRGEHKIYARLMKNGRLLASTTAITIYVFRPGAK